jgi:hypothetical protein
VTDLKKLTSGYGSEMQRHWDQILWPGGGSAVVIAVIPVTGTKGSPEVYYRGKSSGWINGVIVNISCWGVEETIPFLMTGGAP